MAIEVKIPAVGESISSGVVSVWHKKSGDFVNAGDALFTLETDKVSTQRVYPAEQGVHVLIVVRTPGAIRRLGMNADTSRKMGEPLRRIWVPRTACATLMPPEQRPRGAKITTRSFT